MADVLNATNIKTSILAFSSFGLQISQFLKTFN